MSHLSKLTQIARRDFTRDKDIDESDDDEEGSSGKYNIDPSSNMWKPIDFGRSSKKGAGGSFKSSESESALRPLVSKSEKTKTRDGISSPRAHSPPRYISPRNRGSSKEPQEDKLSNLGSGKTPSIIANADKKKSFARLTAPHTDSPPASHPPQSLERHASAQLREHIERQKLAKEKEEMRQMLDAIHLQKRELAKLSEETTRKATLLSTAPAPLPTIAPEPDPTVVAATQALAKEREEMRLMMEEIQREKKEIMTMNAKRAKEKSQETALAAKERDELRIALETMRSENERLGTQMRNSAAAAKLEIEEERKKRQEELRDIEAKNKELTQQVLERQAEAERKLAAERDELRAALKRMEHEKLDLSRKVSETEDQARADALALEAQRKSFQEHLQKMESEKEAVYRQVAQNEAAAKSATEEMSRKLAKEKEELQKKLQAMETDKSSLAQSLQEKEANAKKTAEELAERLAEEKKALMASTKRMEEEKMEMAKTLSAAEQQAKEQARIVSEQLEKEKKALQETKSQMQQERETLEAKLQENEKRSQESSMAMSDELKEERERLQAHLDEMRKEKEDMEARLKEAADQALEREKAANDKLARERDELRQAVERMKEEMELEKKRLEEEKKSMSKSKQNLKPTSSLYDMMEASAHENDEDSQKTIKKETRNNRSHAIIPIVESEEEIKGALSHDAGDAAVDDALEAGDTVLLVADRSEGSDANTEIDAHRADEGSAAMDSSVEVPVDTASYEEAGAIDIEAKSHIETDVTTAPPSDETFQDTEVVAEEEQEEVEEDDFVDLPAPHAAAARGDLEKLRNLSRVDPGLLASFDEAGRCPLFYAVAYDRASVTSFLLGVAPECMHQTDSHGDTPLHASASSGSEACVRILLNALKENKGTVNPRNSMGMTPVHLSMNAAVLSLLYEAGADLTAVDKSDRSALFVAAAMNRKECVEFLLDCLDGDDDALYMQDSRGDTPLHAAACNGAEDSLLLLLQCGISPLTTNKRGLKAIDLAQKNKKKKCREILAQYHLHFATNSDFDSVLFIAALEGHKKAQDEMVAGGDTEEKYNIIKSEDDDKAKAEKLFSLSNKKSLRLKRWGSWIAYEDQNSSSTYWYNHKTGTGQWNIPDSVAPMMKKQSFASHSSKSILQISSKASMRLKRVGEWIQYSTEAGQTFYYNEKNGDFQWVNPEKKDEKSSSEMMEQAKEEEWVPYKDPDSGCIFWYNKRTNVSQWECPLAPGEGAENHDVDPDAYAADLVEVHDDADLGI